MLKYLHVTAYHRFLLSALLAMAAAHGWAKDAEPQLLMSATYQARISGWNVELERTLTQYPSGRYALRSYASKLIASIEETSVFTIKNGLIQPLEYRYHRNVFGRKATEKIVYDWEKQRAYYTRSDREQNNTEHKLTPGLLDPALYQLAIQADLAKGHNGLHYSFIKRKRIEHYQLEAKEDETVSFADKNYAAIVVLREDPDSDKSTKVWTVPALNYIVAKIEHTDKKGDEFEINLTKFATAESALNDFYSAFSNNSNKQESSIPPKKQTSE